MPRGRPAAPISLDAEEKNQLLGVARSRSLPHGIVRRAQIVLACADGESNTAIAERMGVSNITVGKWRRRYREGGPSRACTTSCAPAAPEPTRTSASPK